MSGSWEALIERYADGRSICNCRQAYYSQGEATIGGGVDHGKAVPHPICQYGCQANQCHVREYIAARVLRELDGT